MAPCPFCLSFSQVGGGRCVAQTGIWSKPPTHESEGIRAVGENSKPFPLLFLEHSCSPSATKESPVTWYELFLFLHIASAIIWVGGGFFLQVLSLRVLGTKDEARIAGFAGDVEVLGTRVFMPASLLLIVTGAALAINGNWDWSEPFISFGLLVWIISVVAGVAYLGPTSGKIKAEIESGGANPRAQQLIGNVLRYSRIELVLLWIVVFMMVVKLGG